MCLAVYSGEPGAASQKDSSSQRDGVPLAVNRAPALLKQAGIYGPAPGRIVEVHGDRPSRDRVAADEIQRAAGFALLIAIHGVPVSGAGRADGRRAVVLDEDLLRRLALRLVRDQFAREHGEGLRLAPRPGDVQVGLGRARLGPLLGASGQKAQGRQGEDVVLCHGSRLHWAGY